MNEPIEVEVDFSSLNLVDFVFVPHYRSKRMSASIPALHKYSSEHQIVVYACQDSGGIVVIDDNIKLIGDVYKIDER